ncbi:MAG: hypothetical protein WC471_05415 [Candidatus Woesearchaeota archaeon]
MTTANELEEAFVAFDTQYSQFKQAIVGAIRKAKLPGKALKSAEVELAVDSAGGLSKSMVKLKSTLDSYWNTIR